MGVKRRSGVIVSDRMRNVRIVEVTRQVLHKRYSKVIKCTKRYAVYDNFFNTRIGDKVRIRETKPLSKTMNWCVVSVVEKVN
jgi:small subunit ribosomal protein S17